MSEEVSPVLKIFYQSKSRQWTAVFLSALFALGIIVGEHEYAFRTVEQPHLGQERGDESPTLIVNAPSMYANASPVSSRYTWQPGSMVPTIFLADPYHVELNLLVESPKTTRQIRADSGSGSGITGNSSGERA
jgi:hypothetical protein